MAHILEYECNLIIYYVYMYSVNDVIWHNDFVFVGLTYNNCIQMHVTHG